MLHTQNTLKLDLPVPAQVTLYDQWGRLFTRLEGDALPELLQQAHELARTRVLTAYPAVRE